MGTTSRSFVLFDRNLPARTYLRINVRLRRQKLVGALLDDTEVLHDVVVFHSLTASEKVAQRSAVAPDPREERTDTWGGTNTLEHGGMRIETWIFPIKPNYRVFLCDITNEGREHEILNQLMVVFVSRQCNKNKSQLSSSHQIPNLIDKLNFQKIRNTTGKGPLPSFENPLKKYQNSSLCLFFTHSKELPGRFPHSLSNCFFLSVSEQYLRGIKQTRMLVPKQGHLGISTLTVPEEVLKIERHPTYRCDGSQGDKTTFPRPSGREQSMLKFIRTSCNNHKFSFKP